MNLMFENVEKNYDKLFPIKYLLLYILCDMFEISIGNLNAMLPIDCHVQ